MYLTDLAAAARKSGLTVAETSGWEKRGHGPMTAALTVVCHHTAGPVSGDMPSLRIVSNGRSDLPGPLCNLALSRSGIVYVVAAGLAYHAGAVTQTTYDNAHAIGIEAEATGVDPWPPAQMTAYALLCRALVEHYRIPVSRVLGHKEVCKPHGRKIDPNFDMTAFRARVNAARLPQEDEVTPADEAALANAIVKEFGSDGRIGRAIYNHVKAVEDRLSAIEAKLEEKS